jgi:mannan endo-1,4-beta-mannosidase
MLWGLPAKSAVTAYSPVTPNSSPEAQALMSFYSDIYGKKVIAGQHDGWRLTNGLSEEMTYITNTTGKLPGFLEMDVSGYTSPHHDPNHRLMSRALNWTQNWHGIAGFCWHWRAPMNEPAFYSKDTHFDISRAVIPGTPEYAAVEHDMDTIAGELVVLRDAHVPVMWRPLHEANGRWFWWGTGGPEPFKKLWRMMFENFAVKHQLNNLVWVFSPGAETDLADWYPGDAYVDIVGQDHYPMDGNHNSANDVFDELRNMTRGEKLIALGENGPIPDPALMTRDHAGWLFFSTWSGSILFEKTTPEQLRADYNDPHVLTLTDLPDLSHYPVESAGPPTQLACCGQPGDLAVAGNWRMPLTVAVEDDHGRAVRTTGIPITLALQGNGGGKLLGTTTAQTINGLASFPDISIATAGDYQLVANANGLRQGTSPTFKVGPGNGLLRQWWTGPIDATDAPDQSEVLGKALETPVALVTNFSARITGVLIPPQTGSYQFWLAGGGVAELALSTNDLPAGKLTICKLTRETPYQKWPHTSEAASMAVTLSAGEKYYFEIQQHQENGSTQLHVRWQLPDGSEERPIPAYRFTHLE